MQKVKVCFFINGFAGGGAERQCAFLINELQKDDAFEVSLIYFFEGVNFKLVNQQKLKLYKIEAKSLYSLANIRRINQLVGVIKPDFIYSWMQAPDVLSFFVKLRYPSTSWILSERNSKYKTWDYRFVLRALTGRFANLIIANSVEGKAYWKKRLVKDSKITVMPNILYPANNAKNTETTITGTPSILFAGRFEPQKNVLVTTTAFCKLSKIFTEGKFYLIGEGGLKAEMETIIANENATSSIVLLPFQNNVLSLFAQADVFVSLSHYEGLPNTLIENVALNSKIVVSAISQHVNVLGENYPYYVRSNSVDECVNVISEILKDDDFQKHLSFAKEKIKEMSPDNIVGRYKAIFGKN